MAAATIRARTHTRHQEQLAALRALAAELSGERRLYQRQSLAPRLPGRLELDGSTPAVVPLLLVDLGCGGARALAPAGTTLQAGNQGRLLTGQGGRPQGMRRVLVRWIRPQRGMQLLGLSFEPPTCTPNA
jgi:hypothetical protein